MNLRWWWVVVVIVVVLVLVLICHELGHQLHELCLGSHQLLHLVVVVAIVVVGIVVVSTSRRHLLVLGIDKHRQKISRGRVLPIDNRSHQTTCKAIINKHFTNQTTLR